MYVNVAREEAYMTSGKKKQKPYVSRELSVNQLEIEFLTNLDLFEDVVKETTYFLSTLPEAQGIQPKARFLAERLTLRFAKVLESAEEAQPIKKVENILSAIAKPECDVRACMGKVQWVIGLESFETHPFFSCGHDADDVKKRVGLIGIAVGKKVWHERYELWLEKQRS